ncbi:MAG: ion transporter [Rikenellaceae bacterium]|nr:ion transporter [Rikenellaceae bacterium]
MSRVRNIFLNERFILTLIMINAALIFFQEFEQAPRWLEYTDNIFTILFAFEMFVKIRTYGDENYWKNNWNRLDGILVIIALFGLILELFRFIDAEALQIILTIRVLRVFKSFRLIRFVPNIKGIIAGVKRALKSSYIVIMAFSLLLFISAILTCSLFKDVAPEYFNTPLDSMYSVFRIFSVEGWTDIPDLIATRTIPIVGFLTKVYFVVLLFAGGILGMSLINSIFVDAMISPNSDKLEAKVELLTEKLELLLRHARGESITDDVEDKDDETEERGLNDY